MQQCHTPFQTLTTNNLEYLTRLLQHGSVKVRDCVASSKFPRQPQNRGNCETLGQLLQQSLDEFERYHEYTTSQLSQASSVSASPEEAFEEKLKKVVRLLVNEARGAGECLTQLGLAKLPPGFFCYLLQRVFSVQNSGQSARCATTLSLTAVERLLAAFFCGRADHYPKENESVAVQSLLAAVASSFPSAVIAVLVRPVITEDPNRVPIAWHSLEPVLHQLASTFRGMEHAIVYRVAQIFSGLPQSNRLLSLDALELLNWLYSLEPQATLELILTSRLNASGAFLIQCFDCSVKTGNPTFAKLLLAVSRTLALHSDDSLADVVLDLAVRMKAASCVVDLIRKQILEARNTNGKGLPYTVLPE